MGSRGVALIVASALAAAGAVASCTIDIPDVVEAGPDVVGADDAQGDAPSDAGIIPVCGGGTCAPAGFVPVLFALDRNTTCPAGTVGYDQAADPSVADAAACACDCTVVTPPACVPHVLVHKIDALDAGLCGATSALQIEVDGGCNALSVQAILSGHWRIDPYATVEAGTCASNPKPTSANVTSTPSRICVDPTCATCAAPPGFKVCYAAPGSVPCPKNTTAHTAGTSASLACSPCTACSLTATCGGAVSFFSDNACQTPVGKPVPVDGICTSTGGFNSKLGAVVYEAGLATQTCKAGTSQAGAELTDPVTVCCP